MISNRELATVLAALRNWQRNPVPQAFAEHFSDCKPLGDIEIDSLCRLLNRRFLLAFEGADALAAQIESLAEEIKHGGACGWRLDAIAENARRLREQTISFDQIDWELLRRQKRILFESLDRIDPANANLLEGLAYLLEDLQDLAAQAVGEAEVFGSDREDNA